MEQWKRNKVIVENLENCKEKQIKIIIFYYLYFYLLSPHSRLTPDMCAWWAVRNRII